MKVYNRYLFLSILIMSLFLYMIFDKTVCSAANYPDKWYGWYCPYVETEDLKGMLRGDAFPEQTVINAWGYKAGNIDEIKDLMPEGFLVILNQPDVWGDVRINETAYIPKDKWPGDHIRLRNEATEKYRGEPYLDEKKHIRNYKAGFPFPGSIKGMEIAWNYVKARNYGEKQFSGFVFAVNDRKGNSRYSISANSYMWFNGILHSDDKEPIFKPNPHNYEFVHTLGYKAPYDMRGTVPLTYRYDDPDHQDDMWMYIPSLRRTRRMSTAQRWDRLPGGVDVMWDSSTGFQGKPSNYEWKYLGRKELLCGHNSAYEFQEMEKPSSGIPNQQYQRVNTLVVEYIPQIVSSVSKVVMYLDPEAYQCYYAEYYDKRGRLWLFYNHVWSVNNLGVISPMTIYQADIQRVHSTAVFVYDTYTNRDVKHGVEFFTMQNLTKYFGGR
jgi:hypothetical protein